MGLRSPKVDIGTEIPNTEHWSEDYCGTSIVMGYIYYETMLFYTMLSEEGETFDAHSEDVESSLC